MKNSIRNGLVGLAALVATGCTTTIPTNTEPLRDSPTRYSGYNVKADRQQNKDDSFFYIEIPSNKTFEVGGELLSRDMLADSYGISGKDFKMLVDGGNATFSSDKTYPLVKVTLEDGKVVPNTTGKDVKTEVKYGITPFEISQKSKGIVRRDKLARPSRDFDGIWVGDEYFQRLKVGKKEMQKRSVEGSTPYIYFKDAQPFEEMVVKDGRTNTTQKVRVVQYVQMPGKLVDAPKKEVVEEVVKKPEAPKPEELVETTD